MYSSRFEAFFYGLAASLTAALFVYWLNNRNEEGAPVTAQAPLEDSVRTPSRREG